jgi:hypothetical protein
LPRSLTSGHGDGRTGVAARGFEDDVGFGADLAQLVGDEKAIVRIGDDDRRLEGSASMAMVVWKVERSPTSGMNCLGRISRDSATPAFPRRRT